GWSRFSATVLPGQPAARQRAERLEAETVALAQREHFGLRLAAEERVRVLHELVAAQVLAGDVAPAHRADLPFADELAEDSERVGQRRVRIGLVRQVQVDALDAEAAKAALDGAPDPGRRQTSVARPTLHRVEHLR